MADIQTAIRKHLLADATIAAAVGTRIYADVLEQDSPMSAIVLEEISQVPINDLAGEEQLSQIRLRAKCYATLVSDAVALRKLVKTRVNTTRGTTQSVWISGASTLAKGNGVDDPLPGSADWRLYRWIDFRITYRDD